MLKSLFDLPQLDAQLADMDSHREKAVAAVGKGNSVLQDAANTLRTLKGSITIFLDLAKFLNIWNCNAKYSFFTFFTLCGKISMQKWPKKAYFSLFPNTSGHKNSGLDPYKTGGNTFSDMKRDLC